MVGLYVKYETDQFIEYRMGDKFTLPGGGWNHSPSLEQREEQGYQLPGEPPLNEYTEKYSGYELIGTEIRRTVAYQTADELAASLDMARVVKGSEINNAFTVAEKDPIDHEGHLYPGGYESAQKRDDGRNLVIRGIELGWLPADSTVDFYDVDGKPVPVSIDTANHIVLLVGFKYQSDLSQLNAKLVQIEEATTAAEVLNITW